MGERLARKPAAEHVKVGHRGGVQLGHVHLGFQAVIGFVDFPTFRIDVAGQNAATAELRQGLVESADAAEQVDEGEAGRGSVFVVFAVFAVCRIGFRGTCHWSSDGRPHDRICHCRRRKTREHGLDAYHAFVDPRKRRQGVGTRRHESCVLVATLRLVVDVSIVLLALGRFVAAPGALVVNHLGVLRG